MKGKLLKSTLLALVGVGLLAGAGSVSALPFDDGIFQLEDINTYGAFDPKDISSLPFDATNTDQYGYYIWSNASRTDWTVLWTGDSTSDANWTDFSGDITLYGSEFSGAPTEILFEANDSVEVKGQNVNNVLEFDAWAGSGGEQWYDGFSFTLTNWSSPSYMTFDLKVWDNQGANGHIWLGETGDNPLDSTFAVTAPVPEPATMLLFGAGLIGLAGVSARRKKK